VSADHHAGWVIDLPRIQQQPKAGGDSMKILGFLGSPRVNSTTAKLLKKALEGAESAGAETKRYDLIKFCMGCGNCFKKDPDLPVGTCPLKDDMAAILDEYTKADGYIYASPAYDMYITALMKMFIERKIALTYKWPGSAGKFPTPRPGAAVNFMKKASIIITGNSVDEYESVIGDPCYEAVEADHIWEQIDTVDKLYVGGVESITEGELEQPQQKAYQIGINLVEAIKKARQGQ
jgi:putative NADPH-quinone reductase